MTTRAVGVAAEGLSAGYAAAAGGTESGIAGGAADVADAARTLRVNGRELKPVAGGAPMLGEGGTQVPSVTLLKARGRDFRIDVENPAPGERAGQLHLQPREGGRYLYDFERNEFMNLPPYLRRAVARDPGVARAVEKGRRILNVPSG